MHFRRAACCLGLMGLAAGTAHAQWGWGGGGPYYAPAATAGESHARGMSDLVRSAGDANLSSSEAAINYGQARSQQIDNHLQYTETYFEMRRANTAYRDSVARPQITQEQAVRLAASRMPDRLSVSQLDPVSGEISWPLALRSETFSEDREKIDSLSSSRASAGGSIGDDAYYEIQTTVRSMKNLLVANVRQIDSQDYVVASSFLDSLAHEARYAVQ